MSSPMHTTFFDIPSPYGEDVRQQLEIGDALSALHIYLSQLDLRCTFQGELGTILRFDQEPLSYALRITGNRLGTSVRVIADHENTCHLFSVTSEDEIKSVAQCILDFKLRKEEEAIHGCFRPVPRTDPQLLGTLRSENLGEVQRFAEAARMVEQRALLDAVVELLTPFGLQPVKQDEKLVHFLHKNLKTAAYAGVKIARFAEHGTKQRAVKGGLDLSRCITLLYVRTFDVNQRNADRARLLPTMLTQAGYVDEIEDDDMPQKILLYDLSKRGDMLAMVERILLLRNSIDKEKVPFVHSTWMGKQPVNQGVILRPDPAKQPCAYAYQQRKAMGRVSNLRFQVKQRDIKLPAPVAEPVSPRTPETETNSGVSRLRSALSASSGRKAACFRNLLR